MHSTRVHCLGNRRKGGAPPARAEVARPPGLEPDGVGRGERELMEEVLGREPPVLEIVGGGVSSGDCVDGGEVGVAASGDGP